MNPGDTGGVIRAEVRQHLKRIHRDDEDAADVTQEVFLRLWHRAGQWKGEGPLLAWLLRIARPALRGRPRWREGLIAREVLARVVGARRGLFRMLSEFSSLGGEQAGSRPKGFGVLARARRVERPGIVFARAALRGEVDPLEDEYSAAGRTAGAVTAGGNCDGSPGASPCPRGCSRSAAAPSAC